jgi:hypothetical protein
MAHKVFLHVGAPKTGTTYLQDRLFHNRVSLEKHGVFYPVGGQPDFFRPALDLIDRPWGGMRKTVHGEWDTLVRRVRRSECETILISHHLFAGARPDRVEKAMTDLGEGGRTEVHIVYTARDIARVLAAEWQDQVQRERKVTFARYLERMQMAKQSRSAAWFWRTHGLPDVLSRWGRNLPPERVHLVTVPPDGAPSEMLWRRFCEVVGIEESWTPIDSDRHNQSLGRAEATLLRRLNARLESQELPREDYRHMVTEVIAKRTLAHRESRERVTIPPSALDWADQVAESWIEWAELAKVDISGDLEDLRPQRPEPDAAWVDPDTPRTKDVADAAIDALVAVVVEAARTTPPPRSVASRAAGVMRRVKGRRS